MKNKEVETRLKNAAEKIVPDRFDRILSGCESEARVVAYVPAASRPNLWIRRLGALAAALTVVLGGAFSFRWIEFGRVDTLVTLDVNPSIEIQANRADRVLAVTAKNTDAVTVLDGMDLKGTQLKVAVNALVGSMMKYGYVKESANSLLLSVEGADGDKNATLQRDLTQSISLQLSSVGGAVLSQTLDGDEALRQLAETYAVSYGKAALVQKIIDLNPHLTFADLAGLSVNELNLLIGSKQMRAEGVESRGSASDADFIGDGSAAAVAFSHAGIDQTQASEPVVELDYDDGQIVYEVEFVYNGQEYEYEVDAVTGIVVEYDLEKAHDKKPNHHETDAADALPFSRTDFIGEEEALALALAYAKIEEGAYTDLEIEAEKDDGLYIYELDFHADGQKYDFEINAVTGEVLSFEIKD